MLGYRAKARARALKVHYPVYCMQALLECVHPSPPSSPPTGAEAKVDESLQLMKEVEEVKLKKKQAEDEYHALIPRHAVQQQKLKACEVYTYIHTYIHVYNMHSGIYTE